MFLVPECSLQWSKRAAMLIENDFGAKWSKSWNSWKQARSAASRNQLRIFLFSSPRFHNITFINYFLFKRPCPSIIFHSWHVTPCYSFSIYEMFHKFWNSEFNLHFFEVSSKGKFTGKSSRNIPTLWRRQVVKNEGSAGLWLAAAKAGQGIIFCPGPDSEWRCFFATLSF